MKLYIAFAAFLVASLFVAGIAQAQTTSDIDVVLFRQDPLPAEPGANFNIEVEIQNSGNGQADDVSVEINPKAPFTLLSGEQKKVSFSSIGGQKSARASFRLSVDSDAISNSYELEFLVKEGTSTPTPNKILVNVEGVPKLILLGITTEPGVIEPGSDVKLSFEIKNIGTGTARQVELELGRNESIIPTLSGGKVFLGDIIPGQEKIAVLTISIDPSAEFNTYSTTLTTTYKDENSTQETKQQTVGIPVRGTIVLDVIKVEPSIESGVTKVEVANKGTTEAKSVEAKLYVNNGLVGVDYTSSIKANKQSTFNFPLVLEGGVGKLEVSYIGPGIERNTIEKDISLDFQTPQQDGTGMFIVAAIIIAVVGYWYYRRRKKKRKAQPHKA